jgi:hypothetical protein
LLTTQSVTYSPIINIADVNDPQLTL